MFGRAVADAPPMSYRQELRVFLGFLVQPLVAALFGFVTFPLLEAASRQASEAYTDDMTGAAIAMGLGTGLVAFFVTPLLALPMFVFLRRRLPVTLRSTLVCGAVLGNVLSVPMLLMLTIRGVVFGTAVGVTCAAAFWWIAGRHLQDQGPGTENHGPRTTDQGPDLRTRHPGPGT